MKDKATPEAKAIRQEIVDYIDEFFPKDPKPRSKPSPDFARGHAIVLAGLGEAYAEAHAQEVAAGELIIVRALTTDKETVSVINKRIKQLKEQDR